MQCLQANGVILATAVAAMIFAAVAPTGALIGCCKMESRQQNKPKFSNSCSNRTILIS